MPSHPGICLRTSQFCRGRASHSHRGTATETVRGDLFRLSSTRARLRSVSHAAAVRVHRLLGLAKRLLLGIVQRSNFHDRHALIHSQFELGTFFKLFGQSCTQLKPNDSDCRVLAKTPQGAPVAIVVDGHIFAVPSMIPKAPELEEFVSTLLTGVVKLWERFKQELPAWTTEYRFPGEQQLDQKRAGLLKEIEDIDSRLMALGGLKRVLAYRDEPLVDAVMDLFEKALPLKPKREEAFREDFELLDPSGVTVALVEVKGTSKGVRREHVKSGGFPPRTKRAAP